MPPDLPRMTDDELRRLFDSMRHDHAAHAETRRDVVETRRHFDGAIERMEARFDGLVETVGLFDGKLDRTAAALEGKIEGTAAETQAMIRPLLLTRAPNG